MVHFPSTPELQALHVRLPAGQSGDDTSDRINVLLSVSLLFHATVMSKPEFLAIPLILAHSSPVYIAT